MKTVHTQFNRSATTYDAHSDVQKYMAEKVLERLSTHIPSKILDIGCGTGHLLTGLVHTFPHSKITAIDTSINMINLARNKNPSPNITFICDDIEFYPWTKGTRCDLMVSNAVFQWLKYPLKTCFALSEALTKDGCIVFSTFGPNTFRELISLFQEVEEDMHLLTYHHHLPLRSVDEWEELLKRVNLHSISLQKETKSISYPNCHQFLQSIKAMGASYSNHKHSIVTQKKIIMEVMKRYDERYRQGDSVYATYELIYVKACK